MDRRYEFLDGLRGVAAIVVMLMHFLSPLGWEAGIVPHAHLAVDFFFCLSGFVLTHAYGGMLASGRPMLRRFYLGRAIRLYPMLVLGLAIGTASLLTKLILGGSERQEVMNLLYAMLTNLLLLPSPFLLGAQADAWPINVPQWSLLFESIALLALPWLLRLGDRLLMVVVVATGAAIVAHGVAGPGVMDGGIGALLAAGMIRVAYPFSLGILLHRLRARRPRRQSASGARCAGLAGLLVVVLSLPVPQPFIWFYEVGAVLVLLPGLLLLAASVAPTVRLRPLAIWLGAISYPLYMLHYPVVRMVMGSLRRLDVPAWQYGLAIGVAMAGCLWLAWIALRRIDEPVRRWLTRRCAGEAATLAKVNA